MKRFRQLAIGERRFRILVQDDIRQAVAIKITNLKKPEKTRWEIQRIVNNACGYRGLKNFTDASVKQGQRHRFTVRTRGQLRKLIVELGPMINEDIKLWANGKRVRELSDN